MSEFQVSLASIEEVRQFVNAATRSPCEVLLVPYDRLLRPDGSAAGQQVLQNLVRTISDKYFLLARRVDLLLLTATAAP